MWIFCLSDFLGRGEAKCNYPIEGERASNTNLRPSSRFIFHRPRFHQSVCVRSSNCLKEFPNNNKKRPTEIPPTDQCNFLSHKKKTTDRSKNETISYRDFYVTSGSMEILKMTSRPLGLFNAQRRTSTNKNGCFDHPYT